MDTLGAFIFEMIFTSGICLISWTAGVVWAKRHVLPQVQKETCEEMKDRILAISLKPEIAILKKEGK